MLTLRFGNKFIKSAKKLPLAQQKKLAELLEILANQPYHALLHTKPLSGALLGFYSFRISRDWRVIFQFTDPTEILLVLVGHRKDIYCKV